MIGAIKQGINMKVVYSIRNYNVNICKKIFQFYSQSAAVVNTVRRDSGIFNPPLFLMFKDYFLWFFAATMFALGLVLNARDLQNEIIKSATCALGVLSQFSVMPLLVYLVAQYPGFSSGNCHWFYYRGLCPGAMASNVIVYSGGGAVAFSVTLTTVATLFHRC